MFWQIAHICRLKSICSFMQSSRLQVTQDSAQSNPQQLC